MGANELSSGQVTVQLFLTRLQPVIRFSYLDQAKAVYCLLMSWVG